MELMKFDMCGAATVLAVMKELDDKDIRVNIIAAIPIAENSIGSGAMRPSDILTSYS
jgi:leucyl aminopeptidase